MDCAREYVENYLKSTDSLAYHSFNFVHSLSTTLAEKKHLYATQYTEMKEVSAEEKERLSRERVAREKREYMEAAADKPVISALGEYGSWKPFRNNFRARQRNLRLRIRRLEVRQYYFQMAVEERNERRRIEALAEEERDRIFERDEKALEKEETEKCNQTIASQQMVVNIVQSEYTETYQKHMEKLQMADEKLRYKIDTISKHLETLERKLSQRWRLFGRSKLRAKLSEGSEVRDRLVTMAAELQLEMNRMKRFEPSPKKQEVLTKMV